MSVGTLIGQLDVTLLQGAACLIDIQAIIGNCPNIVIDTHKNPNVTVIPETICVTTTASLPSSTGDYSASTSKKPCTKGCHNSYPASVPSQYPTKPVNPPSSYPVRGDSTLSTSTRRPQSTTTWCPPESQTTGGSSPTSSGSGNGDNSSSTGGNGGNGGASSTGNGGNGGSSTGNGGASSTASTTSFSASPTSTAECTEPLLTLDLSLLGIDVADLKVFLDLAGLLEGLVDTVGDILDGLLGGLLGLGGDSKDKKPINREFQPHCGTSLGNGTTTTATDAKDCLAKCQEDGIKLTLQLGTLNDCLGATIKDGVAVDNCLYVLGQDKDILDLNAELLGDPHGTTYTPATKKQ